MTEKTKSTEIGNSFTFITIFCSIENRTFKCKFTHIFKKFSFKKIRKKVDLEFSHA